MHLKIFYLFIFLNAFSTNAQKVLNTTFYGHWADTEWKFEFFNNSTFRATSLGHFGEDTSEGYYRVHKNILAVDSLTRIGFLIKGDLWIIENDSCIIDFDEGIKYDYCINREVKKITHEDGTWEEDIIYSKIRRKREIRKLKRKG